MQKGDDPNLHEMFHFSNTDVYVKQRLRDVKVTSKCTAYMFSFWHILSVYNFTVSEQRRGNIR